MKFFGLISLLIVVGIGVWLAAGSVSAPVTDTADTSSGDRYRNALDAAKDAANAIERPAGLSSKTVMVYDGISVPSDTRELDLSGRGLSGSLKAEVRQLTELEVLNLSNNNFTGLPAEVGQLTRLRVLNLSNNPLTGLPYELANLARLETLDLRGTTYAPADLAIIRAQLPSSVKILTD